MFPFFFKILYNVLMRTLRPYARYENGSAKCGRNKV
jgi:hypothetical protein